MSDDTPTRRFPASDDTPTTRFDAAGDAATERLAPPPSGPPAQEPLPGSTGGSKRTFTVLVIVGAVLIAALISTLIFVATNRGVPVATSMPIPAAPNVAPTPSETPSEVLAPTVTAPPVVPSGPSITAFAVDETSVKCKGGGADLPDIDLEWSTSNVDQVFFGIDTTDASEEPFFSNLPPSGDASDFPDGYNPFTYSCPAASHVYTITAVGSGGQKVSQSLTVTNTGVTE